MIRSFAFTALLALLPFAGCSSSPASSSSASASSSSSSASSSGQPKGFDVPDRQPGVRAPLTAACGDMDTARCLLPWPSSTFSVADKSTATGIRVQVDPSSLIAPDDPTTINLADGFSRVTPLVTAFETNVGTLPTGADGPVRLLLAQPGAAGFASSVPLRFDVESEQILGESPESFVFGYPLRPLAADSDYVGVVLDDLPTSGGTKPTPTRSAEVALALVAPATLAEAKLAAYHAPTRAVLAKAGIDPHHVLMVWDFTTRSVSDSQQRLNSMRQGALAAVSSGKTTVTITNVDTTLGAPIVAAIEGTLDGLPQYIDSAAGAWFTLDAQGLPKVIGTRTAPFRVVVPVGTGDYKFVMYGHGTGGDYDDTTLDAQIAGAGAAKVGIQFDGWTSEDVLTTFIGITEVFKGSAHAGGMLMQALADATAIQASLTGAIGDALSAPMIDGMPNPAAGRRPQAAGALWAGGSLGGIMSLVAVSADPSMRYGVLNVPGAAWTHFIPKSLLFTMIAGLLHGPYQGNLNALQALAMSQGDWDEIDGAPWSTELAKRDAAFLIQESIGDPVVPNPGTEMVAVVTGATQVGAILVPIAAGIPHATEVDGASGITQYHVTSSDPFDIHGFAAQNTPAGDAARSQIQAFVTSVWAGAPKITAPAGCPNGNCDFSM
jgi:hypothetical protein